MKKTILTVLVLVCFAGSCAADEISDQIKTTFRALEKVNSTTVSAMDNPKNFLEAVEVADAETNLLIHMRENKCTKYLMESKAYYNIAANWLKAKDLNNYIKTIEMADNLLKSAYKTCYPKQKK